MFQSQPYACNSVKGTWVGFITAHVYRKASLPSQAAALPAALPNSGASCAAGACTSKDDSGDD
jgi:hypothetical protein